MSVQQVQSEIVARLMPHLRQLGEAAAVAVATRLIDKLIEVAEAELPPARVDKRDGEVRLTGWRPQLIALVELMRSLGRVAGSRR